MTTTWKIDPTHSEIQFKVKHLMITTITGYFHSFRLDLQTDDDDFTKASKIVFSADVDSISTNNEQRDGHLKSVDFFDVEQHSSITFKGSKYEQSGQDYMLHGDLTIKGITKSITVDVDYGGIVIDPYNQTKAGFSVMGKISRKEFGLTWNGVTETGNIVVSDEIKFSCEIQLIKES